LAEAKGVSLLSSPYDTSSTSLLVLYSAPVITVADETIVALSPRDWIKTAKQAIAAAQIESEQILAIGITNQRETSLLWEKDSGKPVYNAIVWQCRRSAGICQELRSAGLEKTIRGNRTCAGSIFFGTNLSWGFREERPDLREGAGARSSLWNHRFWTYLQAHRSYDHYPTNASRTLLSIAQRGLG